MRKEKALIFELGSSGREGFSLPASDVPEQDLADLIPPSFLRETAPDLPEVSEGKLSAIMWSCRAAILWTTASSPGLVL